METNSTIEPEELFRSTKGLDFQPLGYSIVLGMFMTRWWRPVDGERTKAIYVRFDHCRFIKVNWTGELGPYNIEMRRLGSEGDGLIEVCDDSSEFRVVCEQVHIHPVDQMAIYYRNLSRVG